MVDNTLMLKLQAYIEKYHQDWGTALLEIIGKALGENHRPDYAKGVLSDDVVDGAFMFLRTNRNYKTFAVCMEEFRECKGLTPAKLYTDALIDKRLYSKIIGKCTYHPSKNTAISLGLALILTMDEMNALLGSAGYSLSRSIVSDLIIMFCIENKIYNLHDVNELLYKSKQKMLCREVG
jgi:hypothetical protein